ncbi:ABC-2 type transport system ATP-binding protein [Clostridium cavendishii DSM 21758]|uniref:ABC-2 type transport system ATP-binding protein n=1 Tax=Clostridium cavendishii DSM 21758 TaxID=1121302 RepID=A0A1M6FA54_9CLOT|nr:ABC transporter ATP-binding protein [Clostridium cavendishii]SHI94543.1 ABC-2 type transport system ATP-binding protein [Clostridium cavendishii DSM 21758]
MFAIEVKNLTKQYKNGVKALDDLNLTVKKGEIFSLLGPNGAGKSSLINILTTFYNSTYGTVNILGKNLSENPHFVRNQIACVAQQVSIDEHLSLMENMLFQSRLYKVDSKKAEERIKKLIDIFDLSNYLKYPVSSYSGGVKRRLDIAINLVSLPKILFLDEPTVGMDVESRATMWKMLLKIRDELGTTIFLTTHYLEEADFLSDTICIMKKGQILAQGSRYELENYINQNIIRILFPSTEEAKKYINTFDTMFKAKITTLKNKSLFISLTNNISSSFIEINKLLLNNCVNFIGIEIMKPSLEDIFLIITNSNKYKMEGEKC